MDYLSICIFISLVERRMQPLVSTILKLYRKCVCVCVRGVGGVERTSQCSSIERVNCFSCCLFI